jgi:periplasmic copper chaperone A
MKRRAFLALALLPKAAFAHSYKLGTLAIGHAWALPSQQTDGQVFLPIVNNGKTPDALIAARSEMCSLIELRTNNRYDDPPATRFDLEPGKPFAMRPAARHLRLIGLSQTLDEFQSFNLILDFETAGEIEISVEVEAK